MLNQLSATLNQTPGVAFASPPRPNAAGDAAIMQVVPTTSPQDKATDDLVDRVRHEIVPKAIAGSDVTVAVGGLPAAVDDFANYTFRMLPLVVGLVLLLSFILLMLVFRSILVPLKAVVMNLLSVGAAYGVMVAVFQWGWGISLIGVGKEGPIEAWAPLMLFAVVFGLSMDYEVFLLSRIKEEYDRTGDNAQAVADGLAVTARVITAAAAIMVCVFGAFVLGPDRAAQGLRPRHGGRGAHRRDHRPARAGAGDDGAPRRPQLVDPGRGSTASCRASTSRATPTSTPSSPSSPTARHRPRPRRRPTGTPSAGAPPPGTDCVGGALPHARDGQRPVGRVRAPRRATS